MNVFQMMIKIVSCRWRSVTSILDRNDSGRDVPKAPGHTVRLSLKIGVSGMKLISQSTVHRICY